MIWADRLFERAGTAILFGTASPWLVLPAFVVIISRQFIAAEERKMEREFGAVYLANRSKVRRWL